MVGIVSILVMALVIRFGNCCAMACMVLIMFRVFLIFVMMFMFGFKFSF